jgi:hypothetical protein
MFKLKPVKKEEPIGTLLQATKCGLLREVEKKFVSADKSQYVRKDVFEEYTHKIEERCDTHSKFINDFRQEQKQDRDRQTKLIVSTLIFVVCTLVSMLTAIVVRLL